MRLRDNPIIEVSRKLSCTAEQAWGLVTDIELPTRVDGELQRVKVDQAREGCVVRQWGRFREGESEVSKFIESQPDREGRIIDYRMAIWRRGMQSNLDYLEQRVSGQ